MMTSKLVLTTFLATALTGCIFVDDDDDDFFDADGDGVEDSEDNCPNNANPGQENTYGDGRGDVCETPDPTVIDGKFHAEWMFADAGRNCASLGVTHVEYLFSVTDDSSIPPEVYPFPCEPLVGETETMPLDDYTWTAQAVDCTGVVDPAAPCDPLAEPSLAIDTSFFAADGVTASCTLIEGQTCVVDLPVAVLTLQ
jgi:hypothetical protein